MAERVWVTDADIERRLRLIESATAQPVASNPQMINSVEALGLENVCPDSANALTQSSGYLAKTFRGMFGVAAPEAAKVEEGQDA